MSDTPKILVIGGGVSGLACAFRLHAMRLPVLLTERSSRFGGVIDTVEKGGFRFDVGPQSFLSTTPLESLITELNLSGDLLRAAPNAPRYILHHGKLVAAPLNPIALLTTPLFGWRTKRRLLLEPFLRTTPPDRDESVADFARRKFGEDILANLVAPFISGVYAGDPEHLSLASAFPPLRRLEAEYGSIIRGAIRSPRKGRRTRPQLSTFRKGLNTLTQAIAGRLQNNARSDCEVVEIKRSTPGNASKFEATIRHGAEMETVRVAAIVLATPAGQASRLLSSLEPRFRGVLDRIEYAPVAEIGLGYRCRDISEQSFHRTGGFGFLVPRSEGLRSLGTVWASTLFQGRAPDNFASFTTFMGGATDSAIRNCSEDEVAATAHAELSGVLGIRGAPIAQHIARWDRALPQYNVGHGEIVRSLEQLCGGVPGLFLAGNYLSGPSLGACVEQANKVADEAAAHLARA